MLERLEEPAATARLLEQQHRMAGGAGRLRQPGAVNAGADDGSTSKLSHAPGRAVRRCSAHAHSSRPRPWSRCSARRAASAPAPARSVLDFVDRPAPRAAPQRTRRRQHLRGRRTGTPAAALRTSGGCDRRSRSAPSRCGMPPTWRARCTAARSNEITTHWFCEGFTPRPRAPTTWSWPKRTRLSRLISTNSVTSGRRLDQREHVAQQRDAGAAIAFAEAGRLAALRSRGPRARASRTRCRTSRRCVSARNRG